MLVRFCTRTAAAPQRFAAAASSSLFSVPQFSAVRWNSTEGEAKPAAEGEAKKEEEETTAKKPAEAEKKKEIDPPHKHETDKMKKKIEALEEHNADLKKEVAYVTADAQNARRIGREDTDKAKNFAVTGFAKDMLEVADTLDRSIEALNKLPKELVDEHKALSSILTGVKMSESVLQSAFNKHGINKVESKPGTPFDPKVHDALFNAPATAAAPAGTISTVVKGGYVIKERVLRAAQVGVAEEQK